MEKKLTKKKPNCLIFFRNRNRQFEKKSRIFKKGDEIPLLEKIIVPFNEPPLLFETPFEIKIIATAPIFFVFKYKKSKIVFNFFKKRKHKIQPKCRIDPVTTKLF